MRWATLAACLAALPQLVVYAGHVYDGDYPGSAYAPRVDTMLQMSASAAAGGPFAAVRQGDHWVLAAPIVPDLGVPALLDVTSRIRGRPATTRSLGVINLAFLSAALFGLVFAVPGSLRWGLVPVFLCLPLSVHEYRSPDTVAIHGALAALAIASAALVARPGPVWTAAVVGVTLFVLAKVRSVYGMYALVALAAVTAGAVLVPPSRRVLARAALALGVLLVCGLMWAPVMRARGRDPRVADRGIITTHDVYATVISGVGWSPNRWDIGASDPQVLMFVMRRLGLSRPTRLDSEEGEMYSRRAYLSLWREDPWHLVGLHARRLVAGVGDYMILGRWGAPLWLAVVGAAAVVAWRGKDVGTLAAVLASAALTACLLAQVALIDPRFIYSYPLRFVSTLTLAFAVCALLAARLDSAHRGPQGAPNSSRG